MITKNKNKQPKNETYKRKKYKNTSITMILARMTQDRFDNLIFIAVITQKQRRSTGTKTAIQTTQQDIGQKTDELSKLVPINLRFFLHKLTKKIGLKGMFEGIQIGYQFTFSVYFVPNRGAYV